MDFPKNQIDFQWPEIWKSIQGQYLEMHPRNSIPIISILNDFKTKVWFVQALIKKLSGDFFSWQKLDCALNLSGCMGRREKKSDERNVSVTISQYLVKFKSIKTKIFQYLHQTQKKLFKFSAKTKKDYYFTSYNYE